MAKRALTVLAVERLKPPRIGQVDHFDSGYPGLALRVSYGGGKSFVYFYRLGRRQRRMTLGQWPAMKLEEARSAWREARMAVAEGRDPVAERRARKAEALALGAQPAPDTFEIVASKFAARHIAQKARRTQAEYHRHLAFLESRWRGRLVGDIRKRDVIEVLDELLDAGKPVEANRCLALAKTFFGWCVEREYLETSPAAAMKAPTEEKPRQRVLADDELRALWDVADEFGPPFGTFVRILMLTGVRRAEAASMRWQDIDLAERTWIVPQTKAGVRLLVPLAPAAIEILDAVQRFTGPYVVTTTGGKRPISGFSTIKRRIDRRLAEVLAERGHEPPEPWVMHDIRRTVRTGLSRLKVKRHVAELVIGHRIPGIQAVYDVHDYADEKRDALERWAAFLGALVVESRGSKVTPFLARA